MLRYLIRRLVALVPTFLLASVIVFSAIRLIPGDTIDMMMSQNDISASVQTREDLIKALGLDQPVLVQYWHWISSIVLHGDFGRSLWTGESVTSLVAERIPATLYLGVLAMIFALLIALPVGIISAIRQNKPVDYLGRVFAITAPVRAAFLARDVGGDPASDSLGDRADHAICWADRRSPP